MEKQKKKVETKQEKTKVTKKDKTTTKDAKVTKKDTKTNKKPTKKISAPKKPFFKEAISELKKVRWPIKKEMIKYSIATLIVILLLGVFFIATDLIVAGIKMIFV